MTLRKIYWSLRYGEHLLRREFWQFRVNAAAWRRFWRSYDAYRRLDTSSEAVQLKYLMPRLGEDTAETSIEPIYFYQDAWAFEKIVRQRPDTHVDVGSHHKFVALLSKVVATTMVDIRPLSLPMDTIHFRQGSILDLPYADQSVTSLSSICVVEHIGLGRYGDPLDDQGTEKAIAELKRVIAPGGNLYLSLPLDDENRIYFNAHRAFQEEYVEEMVRPLEIVERRYIYGTQFVNERQSGFGTGCYHLRRSP